MRFQVIIEKSISNPSFGCFIPRKAKLNMPEDSSEKQRPQYRRVILKLSGESLAHSGERGISMDEVTAIAKQIRQAHELGCQIAVVVGGGNILRGTNSKARAAR